MDIRQLSAHKCIYQHLYFRYPSSGNSSIAWNLCGTAGRPPRAPRPRGARAGAPDSAASAAARRRTVNSRRARRELLRRRVHPRSLPPWNLRHCAAPPKAGACASTLAQSARYVAPAVSAAARPRAINPRPRSARTLTPTRPPVPRVHTAPCGAVGRSTRRARARRRSRPFEGSTSIDVPR
jgi:hypothetical protein